MCDHELRLSNAEPSLSMQGLAPSYPSESALLVACIPAVTAKLDS